MNKETNWNDLIERINASRGFDIYRMIDGSIYKFDIEKSSYTFFCHSFTGKKYFITKEIKSLQNDNSLI